MQKGNLIGINLSVSFNRRPGSIHGSQRHLIQMPPAWSLTSAFHCMLALKLHVAEPGLSSGPEPHSTHFTQRCWLFSQFQFNNKNKNLKQAFWLVQVWSGADSWTNQLWPGRWSPIRKWRSNTWGVVEKQFPEEEREMMGRPPSPPKKIHSDSFYRCGNLGSEKLSDLLKVTTCT